MITSLTRSLISSKSWYRSMMAGNTPYTDPGFDLLSTTILSGTAASVTFDVSTYAALGYKHLQIRLTGRSSRADVESNFDIRFNSDTGANYSRHLLQGNGSAVQSGATASSTSAYVGNLPAASSTANLFGATIIDILDPFSTSKNKTVRSLSGQTSFNLIILASGAWYSTAATTSLTLLDRNGANFITGSRFSIYGVKG